MLPACRSYGLGVLPWSPLAGGMLGGALAKAVSGRRTLPLVQESIATNRPKLEAYEAFCKQLGHPPGDVALAWLLHQPAVTAPIVGPRTMAHLKDALRASELRLDEAALAKLDEIWPGPGGEAPEAYAW
ncbi:MAG: aldo/keto reductase [Myxococcales bacterium]